MDKTVIIGCAGGYVDYRINVNATNVTIETRKLKADDNQHTDWRLIWTAKTPESAMQHIMNLLGWL